MLWPIKIEKVKEKEIEREGGKESERGKNWEENRRGCCGENVGQDKDPPWQNGSFLPAEPHISYRFTPTCGPKRPEPQDPGSLPTFPAPHLSGRCSQEIAGAHPPPTQCPEWGFLQEAPSHVCFIEAAYKRPLK